MISEFDPDEYEKLYPETRSYRPGILNKYDRLYDHYIKFGKDMGYACNHKTLPVYYHIPKCGGTSIINNLFLINIDKQYDKCIQSNGLYIINITEDDKVLFILVGYPVHKVDTKLFQTTEIDSNRYFYVTMPYDTNKIASVCETFCILSMIIVAHGLKNANSYTDLISKKINKPPQLYTILRSPEDRYKSEFYYLRDMGSWELTSAQIHKNISFFDYLKLDVSPDNFIIRNLVNVQDTEPVNEESLGLCKDLLNSFTHVGFLNRLDLFISFICQKYNWTYDKESKKLNQNTVSKIEPISEEIQLLLNQKNFYDNKLYNYFYTKHIEDSNV